MPKSSTSHAYAPPDPNESPTYSADLTPGLQQALAILADIDIYYDEARQKLERWPGLDAIKQRCSEQLEERRLREREPHLRRLIGLEQQMRRAALLKARPFH